MVRHGLMNIERRGQPTISDQGRNDGGELTRPEELGGDGIFRGKRMRQGIVDAHGATLPQLTADQGPKVTDPVLADKAWGRRIGPAALNREGLTTLTQFIVPGAVRLQVVPEHLRGRGHDLTRLSYPTQACAQIDQKPEPLLSEHALRRLLQDNQNTTRLVSPVHDRA